MRVRGHPFTPVLAVPITLAAMMLPGSGTTVGHAAGPGMAPQTMKIEVTVKDREKGYDVKGHTIPGVLTTIVVRNEDTVAHGFTSTLFKQVPVKLEGDGAEVRGKHFKSFHVDAGKSMTLHFTAPQGDDRETIHYVFWCDMHPAIRGEVLMVETRGEIGGG